MEKYIVITFYKFIGIENVQELQIQLLKLCKEHLMKGTILLAREGINATLVGREKDVEVFVRTLLNWDLFCDLNVQKSASSFMPFRKLKVKIKNEIVTFRQPNLGMSQAGRHIEPEDWDQILSDKSKFVVIDTRNDYEVRMGTFENALNPGTKNFAELKDWARTLDIPRDMSIAMFCTGGVRCEKSTAYFKSLGYQNVYQLKGGILNYLAKTQNKNQMWKGHCFIFDDRRALDSALSPKCEGYCDT